jgi:large subunit ribosomal protein L29
MAILRSNEIAGMEDSEMDEQLSQIRKNLMKIRGVLASGGIPEDVSKTREMKRTIARILTEKRRREVKAKK